jgi:excisionase family DNA binding protein
MSGRADRPALAPRRGRRFVICEGERGGQLRARATPMRSGLLRQAATGIEWGRNVGTSGAVEHGDQPTPRPRRRFNLEQSASRPSNTQPRWRRARDPCRGRVPDRRGDRGHSVKLNQQTVRNWIDRGTLPALRIGRRVHVRRSDFDALLERGRTGGSPRVEPSRARAFATRRRRRRSTRPRAGNSEAALGGRTRRPVRPPGAEARPVNAPGYSDSELLAAAARRSPR